MILWCCPHHTAILCIYCVNNLIKQLDVKTNCSCLLVCFVTFFLFSVIVMVVCSQRHSDKIVKRMRRSRVFKPRKPKMLCYSIAMSGCMSVVVVFIVLALSTMITHAIKQAMICFSFLLINLSPYRLTQQNGSFHPIIYIFPFFGNSSFYSL